MKKNIYILFLLIAPTSLLAQTTTSSFNKNSLLVIVKLTPSGKEIITQNLVLYPEHIERMKALSNAEIKGRSITAAAVFKADLKSYVQLLTLEQFYDLHKIENKYRTNNVTVNETTLPDTFNFLIYDKDVKSVTATTDGITIELIKYQPDKSKT